MSIALTTLGRTVDQIVNIENDGSGNPLFVGFARPGTADASASWLIIQIGYSGGFIVSMRFALSAPGAADWLSYNKAWTGRAGFTYS